MIGRIQGATQMVLRASRDFSVCPVCQTSTRRAHSRYERTLGDLPWEGLPVRILLQARRFFCIEGGCRRRVFTEQRPSTVSRYSRRTRKSSEALDWITLALGGQAGCRLAAVSACCQRIDAVAADATTCSQRSHSGSAGARYRRLGIAEGPSVWNNSVRSGSGQGQQRKPTLSSPNVRKNPLSMPWG